MKIKLKKGIKIVCNYCNGNKLNIIYQDIDYPVVKCRKCGLSFLSPRPNSDQINKLYISGYFNNEQAGVGYTNYSDIEKDLNLEAVRRVDLIKKFINKGKLLDAGCGYGNFLKIAQKSGFDVTGCDLVADVVRSIKRRYHLNVKVCDIAKNEIPAGKFDVITAWDVIEHMPNPLATLNTFHKQLSASGYLFMTTPNIESWDAKIMGKYWYGYKRIPEHLYYFSPNTITKLLEKSGFINVKTKIWGFQRNFGYCIDQITRYNPGLKNIIKPIFDRLNLLDKSLFFPIIDMLVIAQKI